MSDMVDSVVPGGQGFASGLLDMTEFFRKERGVYDDWHEALFRELFQNEIDAGASRIDISLAAAESGAGSRLIFDGNGAGMTEKVMREIFCRPGTTTKTGEGTIGGKGRARVLICFSQAGYRIDTNDIWCAGGSLHPAGDTNVMNYALGALKKPHRGCRIELDIDDASPEALRSALQRVLRRCQMNCAVVINGEQWKEWLHRRVMTREMVDESGRRFGTIHANGSTAARWRGEVMVRVSGVLMFREITSSDQQVIVELEPARARDVLQDNRDGLRYPYRRALQNFLDELATDRESALKGRAKTLSLVVPGQYGRIYTNSNQTVAQAAADGAQGSVFADASVPGDEKKRSVVITAEEDAGISDNMGQYPGGAHTPGEQYAGAIVDDVVNAKEKRLPFLPDIFVRLETENRSVRNTFFRNYHPQRWVTENGDLKNSNAIKTMVLWQTACSAAVGDFIKMLASIGDAQGRIAWGVGWVFSDDALAMHHMAEDGTHALLLNPVDERGLPRFQLADKASWRAMMAEAYHEVAHIGADWHSNSFARIYTGMVSRMDQKAIALEMAYKLSCLRQYCQANYNVADAEQRDPLSRKDVDSYLSHPAVSAPAYHTTETMVNTPSCQAANEKQDVSREAEPSTSAVKTFPWLAVGAAPVRLSVIRIPGEGSFYVLEGGVGCRRRPVNLALFMMQRLVSGNDHWRTV